MDFLNNLVLGFSVAVTPFNLLMAVSGVIIGMLIGALPGVGPASGVALLLPLTFGMPPTSGIIMLAALYAGSMYGGTITAVIINTPGESASVVTCLDGYQMALQGRAGPALGIAAIGSFIAGTFGVVLLMLVSPALAKWALSFGPPETFATGGLQFGSNVRSGEAPGHAIFSWKQSRNGLKSSYSMTNTRLSGCSRL